MTDAKPVAPYGYCPVCGQPGISRERRLDGDDRCASGHAYPSRLSVGEPKREPNAKPDVGALVAEIEFTMPPNKDMACGYDELLDRCRTALIALQAEVARLTQERDLLTSCGIVELMARNPRAMEFVSNLEAERDRLTQENARLAGDGPLREIAELCCELAYQVFQKEDGTRHVVLDNQGRKVWMLSDELMRDLRAAINGGSVGGGDLG